jgi:hypothetical protein
MPKQPALPARQGNDIFREVTVPATGQVLQMTYWDLWFVVVLFNQFGGDWEQMVNHFRQEARGANGRYSTEPKLSHLRQLRQSLAQAGLPAEAVLGETGADWLKQEKRRAKTRILDKSPSRAEMSPWMVYTPRTQHQQRTLRGYWDKFAVSPQQYAEPFAHLFKNSGWYHEDETFNLERKLSAFVQKRLARASCDEAAALYRAVMTVIIEKIEQIDDSYGNIGDFYEGIFKAYTSLPRADLAMSLADFFQDVMELLIWEDYGFVYQITPAFLAGLSPHEAALVENILRAQWQELFDLDLGYQAEEALTLLGYLCAQHQQFEQFVDLARAMGCHHWQRITMMADMAEQQQRPDLALAVYEAALAERGMHERFLRDKYEALKQRVK